MEEQASVIGNGLTNNVVFFIGTTLLKSIRTGCRANNVALIVMGPATPARRASQAPAGTASKLDQEINETAKLASASPSPRAISMGGAKLTSTI